MEVSECTVLVPVSVALLGAVAGGAFTRRNMRRDHADKLLADALNDLVASIATVPTGDRTALSRYGLDRDRGWGFVASCAEHMTTAVAGRAGGSAREGRRAVRDHARMSTVLYLSSGQKLEVAADAEDVRAALSRDLVAGEPFTPLATKTGRSIWVAASSVTHFAGPRTGPVRVVS